MASTVYSEETYDLQDGTPVVLRPLVIARLRRLNKAWTEMQKAEDDEDKATSVLINCCGIALEHEFGDKFESLEPTATEKKNGEVLSKEYKTYLESVLEMDTIYKVMEVCGGLKLNDPNLIAAIAREAAAGTS